jgi:hypothetical protein
MTSRSDSTTRELRDARHHSTFREDIHLHHIELRLADVGERQALYRSHREGDRVAEGSSRSVRRRVGESLVRLGRRIGGDAITSPAWQG